MSKPSKKLTLGIQLIDDANWMGGTLYLRNLAICLSRLPAEERPNLRLLGAPNMVNKILNECGELRGCEIPRRQTLVQRILQRAGLKKPINTPIDLVYPGFGSEVKDARTVRWIPDFQHRYLPDLFSEKEIKARDHAIAAIAARPGVVVFSSETAAKDFQNFFPVPLATAMVWHFCSLLDISEPPKIDPRIKYGLPDKYLYLPNQFWAHKNHITVFKALARLRTEHGKTIPLICTGTQSDRRNLDHFSNLMQFVKDNNISEQVHLLGLIDREDQISVFRFAAAVVQPSLFEGWSTVVEDVRATGRPIFLSDLPVHREQSPNHCSYFSPESDKNLAFLLLKHWDHLKAGPDLEAEEKAKKESDLRILYSARVFNEIISTAANIPFSK